MINNSSINEQILNLSIQMFNAGIQAFNTGKNMNMMMNLQNSYDKLKKISEQINSIIIEYDNMNQMQLMQQQMMMQQMQQQMMMQQQIEAEQQLMPHKFNAIFRTITGTMHYLMVDYDTTVEELLIKYKNKYHEYYEPFKVKGLVFLFNASRIKENEQKTVEDYFKPIVNPVITVNFF